MDERESNLFDRFYKSWRGIEVAYEKIASDCGVTTNVMYILTLLYKNCEPMTQNELSKELHLSKQTVTSVVDSLEKRGWVTLTESGRETGRHIGRTMRRAEFSAFEMLPDEEKLSLVNSMEKLWDGFAHLWA